MYSLEEYYARNLSAYYRALTVGPSHNDYEGREGADITPWVAYFCEGMADSFEKVKHHAQEAAGSRALDRSPALRRLDPRQRKALELFQRSTTINNRDIEALIGISQRAARNLLSAWVDHGILIIADPARKNRKYGLGDEYQAIFD